MADTKIAWCDKVWNPVVGCTKIAAGCKNCYAERFAKRLYGMAMASPQNPEYLSVVDEDGWTGKVECCQHRIDQPRHWRKPQRIFVCSMGDLFHEKVPFAFIDSVFDVIQGCPRHTFLILTKRPVLLCHFLGGTSGAGLSAPALSNAWYGVSISTQDDADRMIPELLKIPGNKFVSYEPALGPVDFHHIKDKVIANTQITFDSLSKKGGIAFHDQVGLDWLIIGCESGPNRRPCKLEWIRIAVEQCKAAGVPCFVKQIEIDGKVEHDMKKFPKDLRVQQIPKGADK